MCVKKLSASTLACSHSCTISPILHALVSSRTFSLLFKKTAYVGRRLLITAVIYGFLISARNSVCVPNDERTPEEALKHATIQKKYALLVTVKNRVSYVKLLSTIASLQKNLQYVRVSEVADVFVFDNGSTEFRPSDLESWFHKASVIEMNCIHDADVVTRKIFEFFLRNLTHEVLVNIDSDALLHPTWSTFIDGVLPRSDGVLSLYNIGAPYHRSFNCTHVMCQKNSTGALGMVLTRILLSDALKMVNNSKSKASDQFDWTLCAYLIRRGLSIYVPHSSLLLHYGAHGAHGTGSEHVEQAVDFDMAALPTAMQSEARFYLHGKFTI